jgi:hypothetical protein
MKLKNKLNHKVHKKYKGIDAVKYSGVVVCGPCALCELIKGWLWVEQNKISVFSVVKTLKNWRLIWI